MALFHREANARDPYDILRERWDEAPNIHNVLSRNVGCITVSGENAILARGFFPSLTVAMASLGEARWWLLDLDGDERFVEFSASTTEEEYFEKLKGAPEWAPGRPFPYAVRHQCFIGRGHWLLLSDRDGERMHMVLRDAITGANLAHILKLIWN